LKEEPVEDKKKAVKSKKIKNTRDNKEQVKEKR